MRTNILGQAPLVIGSPKLAVPPTLTHRGGLH